MVHVLRILSLVLLMSCGGSLTKEQREEMLKAREEQAIKRITDADFLELANAQAHQAVNALEKGVPADSVAKQFTCRVRKIGVNDPDLPDTDQEILNAYQQTNSVLDNIQAEQDSLIFTRSIMQAEPQGSILIGMWRIAFSKASLSKLI